MRAFERSLRPRRLFEPTIPFGPFNSSTQIRWRKKPTQSAQTRLQDQRTRDTQFDKLASHLRKLNTVLKLHDIMAHRKRGRFVSVQIASRWRALVGLSAGVGEFLRHHPHVFDVFPHPERRNACCRLSDAMLGLVGEEEAAVRESELEAVERVRRLLMMSVNGGLRVHALRLVRRELGLPEDFRDSVLGRHEGVFKLVGLEAVELVGRDGEAGSAEVEKWRERERREKWLSEFETRFAFPVSLPTGFRIVSGFREKLRSLQRLAYVKPYERREAPARVRSCGGVERYEKRAVAVLHELLSLTVEKMVEVERLAHFRRDLGMEVNFRELILKHPGIFYVSTKGGTQRVFLREAYLRGCLLESNPIYDARRKMLGLILMGRRYTRELRVSDKSLLEKDDAVCEVKEGVKGDGDWVIPMLESLNRESNISDRTTTRREPCVVDKEPHR